MSVTAVSFPNIALIKYWGNRNNEFRLPAADSLSITLDRPSVEVTLSESEKFEVHSFLQNDSEKNLTEKQIGRFRKTLELMRAYLDTIGANDTLPENISITVRSHIPSGVGIASSAAVFSCLAEAARGFLRHKISLTDEQTSVLARLGSGSAARSVFGGFAALRAGEGNGIGSSVAEQIADERHWQLWDIVLIPSIEEKKVGSTEGHALAGTSPFFNKRIADIMNYRERECIDAIIKRDFEKLRQVSEEDALDMHHVMETSSPSLKYLNADTHGIIKEIESLRSEKHLPVLYTMDAGPTVHLVCEEAAADEIRAYAAGRKQLGCTVFEAKIGGGSRVL